MVVDYLFRSLRIGHAGEGDVCLLDDIAGCHGNSGADFLEVFALLTKKYIEIIMQVSL